MADPAPLVLVVDDTPINCTVAGMLLGRLGCRVAAAGSGEAAIKAIQSQPIDLVLMDCEMPGMDGYQATQRIRQLLPAGRRLPIISLSGHDGDDERRRCREAGMDDHLVKPLLLAVLREKLERWLGAGRTHDVSAIPAGEADAILDPAALANFERMRPGSPATLLGVYIKDLGVVERDLAQAVADGDLAAVGRLTHKLKGSSLTVGARALASAMRELGQLARSGSLLPCRAGWQHAQTVLAQTRAAIGTCIAAAAPAIARQPVRYPAEMLAGQRARIMRHQGLIVCMEAMAGPAMLLNDQRQILTVNRQLLRMLGKDDVSSVVGKRPGEAIGCQLAETSPGCGTAPGCAFCGTVRSVVEALDHGNASIEEARLLIGTDTGHARDLEVTASPIDLDGQRYVLLAMRDIADEKRRQVLERLFFHDMLNGVSGIHGLAVQLAEHQVASGAEDEARRVMARSAQQLIDEIEYQRKLIRAEIGELQVDLHDEDGSHVLREVGEAYTRHPAAVGRRLVFGEMSAAALRTDRVLLRRVLGNLVKNALEATPEGGEVTLGCRIIDGAVRFSVRNPGVMPPVVQQQIFHRSFSTKGAGRGLGTWSAKLLGERYLGGLLSFTSTEQSGTELTFTLPVTS